MGWGVRNDWPASCSPPRAQLFSSQGQDGFLQSSSQSAGALLCPSCQDVALLTPISAICVGRMDHMPATSLVIHSSMGLEMTSLEPGFLKLYFNGFTLVNPSKKACERERLLISIYSRNFTYQHVMPGRTSRSVQATRLKGWLVPTAVHSLSSC